MTVDANGVTTTSGVTFTWDELNNSFQSDEQRAQILSQSGLSPQDVQKFLPALRTYEQSKYKDYEASKKTKRNVGKGLLEALNPANVMLGPVGLGIEGKGIQDIVGKKGKTNYAKDYAQSPLSGLVGQVGEEQKIQQATGAGTAGQLGLPAISQQALDMYTKNYLLPAQAQLHNLIQGDMSQWGSALQNIANVTGQQGSPIASAMEANQKAMSPLYAMLGDATMQAQLTAPYTQLMNQAVGGAATQGAKEVALGTQAQNLALYGLLNPQVAQLLNLSAGSGVGGSALGGTTGNTSAITSLLSGIPGTTQQPIKTG